MLAVVVAVLMPPRLLLHQVVMVVAETVDHPLHSQLLDQLILVVAVVVTVHYLIQPELVLVQTVDPAL
jgi:hypothetical protein